MQSQYYSQNPPRGQPVQQQQGYPPMGQPVYTQSQGYYQSKNGQGQQYPIAPPPPPPPPPEPSEIRTQVLGSKQKKSEKNLPPQQSQNMPQVILQNKSSGKKQNSQNLPQSADGVPYSARVFCSNCRKVISTLIQSQSGTGTWICCLIWGLLAAPLCFIPFCFSNCKDKIHLCPHCQSEVGIYEYKIC